MPSSRQPQLQALESFLQKETQIKYTLPNSPDYASLRSIFSLNNEAVPLAIVRPQSAEDVAKLVKLAISNDIDFTVRGGGHDMKGRSQKQDALTIDMRDIAHVEVGEDKTFAKVGGGIIAQDLADTLEKDGLATVVGSIGGVGFTGWSIYGGYGPYSPLFGLGVDNIIGAKLINAKGDLIDADEELLTGIRGGGGAFGVIVELKVKVYALTKILAGLLIMDSTDIGSAFAKYAHGQQELISQGLPSQLSLTPLVANTPDGKLFAVKFVWASEDIPTGNSYLAKVESICPVLMKTVEVTTLAEFLKGSSAHVPSQVWGSSRTLNLTTTGGIVAETLGSIVADMPTNAGSLFAIHGVRGHSANPTEKSVFGTRATHYLLEVIGIVIEKEFEESSLDWAQTSVDRLKKTAPESVLPGTYISLDMSGQAKTSDTYGAGFEPLLRLQQKYDPENVFKNALPLL